jgi:hypothetical protein
VKPFTTIAIIFFAVICIFHILRLTLGWEAEVAHMVIPMWISAIGAVFSGLLALMLWRESR